MIEYISSGAAFDTGRAYRYELWREWDAHKPTIVWCGLNPSTADESKPDPTVTREINFSRAWGFGRYVKVNAYAWRDTKPKDMFAAEQRGADIVGPENDDTIRRLLQSSAMFVACWGGNIQPNRSWRLRGLFKSAARTVYAMKLTQHGHPGHPLYLPNDTQPFKWITFEAP